MFLFLLARRGRCVSVDCLPTMAEQTHGGYQLSGNLFHGQVYLNNSTNRRRKEKEKIKHNNKTTNQKCCASAALPPPSLTARLGSPSYSTVSLFYTVLGVCPNVSPFSPGFSVRVPFFFFLSPLVLSLSRPALLAQPARPKRADLRKQQSIIL